MKIIYITNARLPTEKAHGLQIMKFCEAFAKSGIDLTLIVPFRVNPLKGDPFDYYGVRKIFKLRRIFSLDFFWLEWFPKKLAFFIQAVSFAFLASLAALFYKNKETIFYSRDWTTLFFLCLFGLKPVAEIHDYRSQEPKRPIRFILNRCRNLIVNSEGTKNLLEDHYKITKEILVAPNGVDADFFDIKETKEEARKILGIPLDKKIIAYVGSLETVGMEKGVGYLLKAFSLLKERKGCILYIVGGPDKLAEEYRKKLPEFGLGEDDVILTGYMEYKKIPFYLRAFDILVIPLPKIQHSITTSPIKVFEYMAAGKAIVASDLPSIRVYLNENTALFFEPENSDDLSKKIGRLLEDLNLIEELAVNARKSSSKYSWASRAEKILNFINLLRICYFGDFDPEYARNRVIINGLRENGVEVVECRTTKRGFGKLWDLIKKYKKIKGQYDILVVGYSDSRFIVPLVHLISRKKIIWDAFYSLYSSYVFDRKLMSPQSLKAKYYWFLDWLSCKLANKILLDTNEHIKYFVRVFKEKPQKFMRSFVGTDDLVFYPRSGVKNYNQFLIHFHGKFVPLQGTEHIVRAANILKNEDIVFQLIGQGQEYERVRKLAEEFGLKNINWIDKVKYEELPDFIKKADVCLGIFGNTPKSKLVIPNKVYEAIAMAKPVISGDTPAIREFFTDREDILLCKTADPEDLAKKILELKNNPELAKKIAEGGYKLYLKNVTPKIIGKNLTQTLKTYGY